MILVSRSIYNRTVSPNPNAKNNPPPPANMSCIIKNKEKNEHMENIPRHPRANVKQLGPNVLWVKSENF